MPVITADEEHAVGGAGRREDLVAGLEVPILLTGLGIEGVDLAVGAAEVERAVLRGDRGRRANRRAYVHRPHVRVLLGVKRKEFAMIGTNVDDAVVDGRRTQQHLAPSATASVSQRSQ